MNAPTLSWADRLTDQEQVVKSRRRLATGNFYVSLIPLFSGTSKAINVRMFISLVGGTTNGLSGIFDQDRPGPPHIALQFLGGSFPVASRLFARRCSVPGRSSAGVSFRPSNPRTLFYTWSQPLVVPVLGLRQVPLGSR